MSNLMLSCPAINFDTANTMVNFECHSLTDITVTYSSNNVTLAAGFNPEGHFNILFK